MESVKGEEKRMRCEGDSHLLHNLSMSVVEVAAGSSVVSKLIEYCSSSRFIDEVNAFKDQHYPSFFSLAEEKTSEHQFAHSDIFEKYKMLLDERFDRFAKLNSVTIQDIYDDCNDIIDGKFTALFDEHEDKWYCIPASGFLLSFIL